MPRQTDTTESFILFTLADATYGLPSKSVKQMEMIEQITPVPNAPPFVEGVAFSRGHVVPAINLRVRFGFERIPHDLRSRLIVVSVDDRLVGLLVDAAREFISIDKDALKAPSEAMIGLTGQYIESIANLNNRVIFILNIAEILRFSDANA
jgi:purine-binding chemotaxis protein CheW